MRPGAAGRAPAWAFERRLWRAGHTPVAGVDEAGRGAWAGPIVAAAVVLPHGVHPFRDSKTLSPARREVLAAEVRACALAWAVGRAEAGEVDAVGVLAATHLAAGRALARLTVRPRALVTDYLRLPWPGPVLAPPRADARSVQAAAASLLAKTARDRWMAEVADARFGAYGFAGHKGYGAPVHLAALRAHGPCCLHRRRFAPVRGVLAGETER
ncbi:MAG: ribonuclease HII [Trueperaceae bacterium]|nr:ribonuclease HII [Trueperaceae bacterium]